MWHEIHWLVKGEVRVKYNELIVIVPKGTNVVNEHHSERDQIDAFETQFESYDTSFLVGLLLRTK